MEQTKEHRRGQRVALTMWVRLGSGGAEIGMASIANASISGAFLETALQLPIGANITLEPVSSAGAALEGAKMAARVVRVEPRGLGLEWCVMATPQIYAVLATAKLPMFDSGRKPCAKPRI